MMLKPMLMSRFVDYQVSDRLWKSYWCHNCLNVVVVVVVVGSRYFQMFGLNMLLDYL